MIDCFDDKWRHERLRRIWKAFAEYKEDECELHFFDNPQQIWNHEICLRMIWNKIRTEKTNFSIITEMDFLPDFENFFDVRKLFPNAGIVAAEYIDGVGGPNAVREWIPAAWFLYFNKGRIEGDVDFSAGGKFNDPCYNLKAYLLPSEGLYPEVCGAKIYTGVHLFWQRHLHDNKDLVVGKEKMSLGEMQAKHDAYVEMWLREAPEEYKRIYRAL